MLNNIDNSLDSVKVSDGINEDEAIIIAEELLKDEKMTDDYLTRYFAQHIKSHYDHVRSPRKNVNQNIDSFNVAARSSTNKKTNPNEFV